MANEAMANSSSARSGSTPARQTTQPAFDVGLRPGSFDVRGLRAYADRAADFQLACRHT
jgi:hypothetical protein